MKRILVPLDGSELAERAIGPALRLAARHGATVHLASVVSDVAPPMALAMDTVDTVWHWLEEEEERTRKYVTEIRDRVDSKWSQLAIETHVVVGRVAPTLLDLTAEVRADLIVLTTRGVTAPSPIPGFPTPPPVPAPSDRAHPSTIRLGPDRGMPGAVGVPMDGPEAARLSMSKTEAGMGADSRARSRVLIVEDEDVLRELIGQTLDDEGFEVTRVASGEEGLKCLEAELFDVVLLDLNLPGMHGLNVLSAAPVTQTDARFIVMTAFGSVGTAVEAMKLGAFDYLSKPFRTEELLLAVSRAIEETELRREVARLRARVSTDVRSRIIGRTRVMDRVFDLIERVAPTRATVLIFGETGTGKELVARAIHDVSDRSRKPFIPVACSALTETLLESELFGHQRGAFTGAIQSKRGVFEAAKGGTLFLDEVGTLAPSTQVKLLRVLQERKVTPVGSTDQIAVDFRLVAATNEDLTDLVREGNFREDLFYRLNVFPIQVPPLRDRREDVPLLANSFRLRFADEHGVEPPPFLKETLARMMAYSWPGNVRELENSVERSMILHGGAKSLPFEPAAGSAVASGDEGDRLGRARQEKWDLERLEREHVLAVLEDAGWHQARASELLGINRRTLYRKLRKYREEGSLPADRRLSQES